MQAVYGVQMIQAIIAFMSNEFNLLAFQLVSELVICSRTIAEEHRLGNNMGC